MHAITIISFILASASATSFLVCGAAANVNEPMRYTIEARRIESIPESLRLLRQFLSIGLTAEQRCERYAVVLYAMNSSPVDSFAVFELALESTDKVRHSFRNLNIEQLRELYIGAINSYQDGPVDEAAVELVGCLERKFHSSDIKARKFLKDSLLSETVKQYKAIADQPIKLVIDPSARHRSLKFNQLTPAVRNTVLDIFSGDLVAAQAAFNQVPIPAASPLVARASASASARSEPSGQPKVAEPEPKRQTTVVAQAPAPTPPPSKVGHQESKPAVEPAAETVAGQLEEVSEGVLAAEKEYMEKIARSVNSLYFALPDDAELPDRCSAYNQLISADPSHVGEKLLDKIAKRIDHKLEAHRNSQDKPSSKPFIPRKDSRENFLVTFASMDHNLAEPEVVVDLMDCLEVWKSGDESVASYVKSDDYEKVKQKIAAKIVATYGA